MTWAWLHSHIVGFLFFSGLVEQLKRSHRFQNQQNKKIIVMNSILCNRKFFCPYGIQICANSFKQVNFPTFDIWQVTLLIFICSCRVGFPTYAITHHEINLLLFSRIYFFKFCILAIFCWNCIAWSTVFTENTSSASNRKTLHIQSIMETYVKAVLKAKRNFQFRNILVIMPDFFPSLMPSTKISTYSICLLSR